MPTEGANSISELDIANPSSVAPAGEGDDHIRMLKEVLTASFPALNGLIEDVLVDLEVLLELFDLSRALLEAFFEVFQFLGQLCPAWAPFRVG